MLLSLPLFLVAELTRETHKKRQRQTDSERQRESERDTERDTERERIIQRERIRLTQAEIRDVYTGIHFVVYRIRGLH